MRRKWISAICVFLLGCLAGSGQPAQAARPEQQGIPPVIEKAPERSIYGLTAEPAPFLEGADSQQVSTPAAPEIYLPWSRLTFNSYMTYFQVFVTEGTDQPRIQLTASYAHNMTPRLNRGCTKIVFSSKLRYDYEIYSINLDGSGLAQLTNNDLPDSYPAWSPDGTRIAFQSEVDGQPEVYVMNADGSGLKRLTWDGDYDGQPAWSPDGSKLAFVSRRSGGYRIYTMNIDGSGVTQLSGQPYSFHPVWSPDGSQVAYDSDGDNDGWQELWLMNADGLDQRQIYGSSEANTDVWAASWSPNAQYIAFTLIKWVYYEGNWYWDSANIQAWDVQLSQWVWRVTDFSVDWYPDWQSTDLEPPVSSMATLPAQSPASFMVSWSGSDALSGLLNYDVEVREGPAGAWKSWLKETKLTSALYTQGVGGQTLYFRVRGRDLAGSVESWPADYDSLTTIESDPPTTSVSQMPAYQHNPSAVHWGGVDPGGSGIQSYDIQYLDSTAHGNWQDWKIGTTDTFGAFSGTPGHTYFFRARARDLAQNVENWPEGRGDASTTLYSWGISGAVYNHSGAPVVGAEIATQPAALGPVLSDQDGHYAAYVANSVDGVYQVNWLKAGYGSLPAAMFGASPNDAQQIIILPPADNLVENWDFEDPADVWRQQGLYLPAFTSKVTHTGLQAAQLGVPARQFSAPAQVAPVTWPEIGLQIAADASGQVHILWEEGTNLSYARKSPGEGWSDFKIVSNSAAYQSSIGVDAAQNAHIVWRENSGIFYQVRSANGSWSAIHQITNQKPQAWGMKMIVESSGAIHLAWQQKNYSYDDIFYAYKDQHGIWSAPENLSNSYDSSYWPYMHLDQHGIVHLVWQDRINTSSSDDQVYYAQRALDGTWSTPLSISSVTASWPGVTSDSQGNIHVVWVQTSLSNEKACYYSRRSPEGSWSTPEKISDSFIMGHPALAIDPDDTLHVIWGRYEPIKDTQYTSRAANGIWSPIQVLDDESDGYPDVEVDVEVDAQGTVHLLWAAKGEVYTAFRQRNGSLSTPLNLSQTLQPDSIGPRWGIDPQGNVHVVWHEKVYPGEGIYYSSLATAPQSGDSSLSQVITIPPATIAPTLSFLYQFGGASNPGFEVSAGNGLITTTLLSTNTNTGDWSHAWFDLSAWISQTITLTFNVHETEGFPYTWAYLDEVSLGSAQPDLWVNASAERVALPGGKIVYTLNYGNHGRAEAASATLSMTLPAGLIFESASITPTIVDNSLSWAAGDLAAGSGPHTILITATVDSGVPLGSTLDASLKIAAAIPEGENFNNTFHARTFIGRWMLLPAILKR